MQAAVPAAITLRRDEGDVLAVGRPPHLVALPLQPSMKLSLSSASRKAWFEHENQFQLPAVTSKSHLIFSWRHALFSTTLLRFWENTQAVGQANLVVYVPVVLQIRRVLVQLPASTQLTELTIRWL